MELNKITQPLITVITPLYNAEKYITETIESVINQTYQKWEMIIVDDCSTDNSRNIVKDYEAKDSRIKLIESESNFGGPARPRNIGLDNTKGDYIAFLDADDVWYEDKLAKQFKILSMGEYDLVHTLAKTIDSKSKITGTFKNQAIYNVLKYVCNDLTVLFFSNYININTVLMKRDLNIQFREDQHLIALEDWVFWIENLIRGKKAYLLEDYLVKYRVDMNSISEWTSDKGYRKIYYLYAVLFLEEKISLFKFVLVSLINTLKILRRKITQSMGGKVN